MTIKQLQKLINKLMQTNPQLINENAEILFKEDEKRFLYIKVISIDLKHPNKIFFES